MYVIITIFVVFPLFKNNLDTPLNPDQLDGPFYFLFVTGECEMRSKLLLPVKNHKWHFHTGKCLLSVIELNDLNDSYV